MDIRQLEQFSDKLSIVTVEDLATIFLKARGLTYEEILDFLCIDLDDLNEAELKITKRVYRKGRAEGISIAVDNLFIAMKGKNGGNVALEYLKTVASTFEIDTENDLTPGKKFVMHIGV